MKEKEDAAKSSGKTEMGCIKCPHTHESLVKAAPEPPNLTLNSTETPEVYRCIHIT